MIIITVDWDGMQELQRTFARLKRAADDGARDFVDKVSDNIYRESQVLVPVLTGKLKKSGRVLKSYNNGVHTATVTYGGPTTLNEDGQDYSVFAHEIPPNTGGKYNTGNTHKPPTTYKYLERPARVEYSRADGVLYKIYAPKLEAAWR